ncbi:MAG: DNA double-strand break repair nuclease NurA [Candidatus Nanoarchaeia archaeon]
MQDIIDFLREEMSSKGSEKPFVSEKSKAYKIESNNFFPLSAWASSKPIAFVDGGSSVFIESPSMCAGFVRVVCVVMENKKTTCILSNEIFVIAKTRTENGRVIYETINFETKNTTETIDGLGIDSLDSTLTGSQERFPISKMIDITRRFLELQLAKKAALEIKDKGIVVLDGSLRAFYPGECRVLEELYKCGVSNNVLITALSKTSSMITTKGDTLNAALNRCSQMREWFYYPAYINEDVNYNADVYFVKFHEKSEYIFTVDIYKEQGNDADIQKVLGFFAYYSKDACFPGYPYGLIKADNLARVSNKETDALLTRLSAFDTGLFELLKPYMNSTNAHSVLDNMN